MKKKYNVLLLSMLSFGLVGCSNQENVQSEKTNETQIEKKVEISEEKTTETSEEEISTDEKISSMLSSLEQGLSNFFTIDYVEDSKSFTLEVKEDSPMYKQLEILSKNPTDETSSQKIKEISESLIGFSESVTNSLGKEHKIILINNFNDLGNFFEIDNGKINYPIIQMEEK